MRNVWITGHRRRLAERPSTSMEALEEIALHRLAAERIFGETMVERLVVDHLGEAAILDAMQALPQGHREVVQRIDVMEDTIQGGCRDLAATARERLLTALAGPGAAPADPS